ncbi:ARM repeat-containing protein [Panus rudis PR-1116 ss-1]|nr:ARM repeat-containing protein [Panus rudis PR-1116 ss-1]
MDVPFISSGAMSRAHYALVRKVETATSAHAADSVLLAEIEAIQDRLSHSTITQKQVKECLVLLLYCTVAATPGVSPSVLFALPHAISLAEAGKTIRDKRLGYVFCAETMPKHHELQLMLVNTLRKDLESQEEPRICLALEALIESPSEDAIPAVQDRLYELLSHTSPNIRRRALLAYRSLSQHNPDLLKHVVDKTRRRLEDTDSTVAGAALSLSIELYALGLLSTSAFQGATSKLLQSLWKKHLQSHSLWLLLKILSVFKSIEPTSSDLMIMVDIVRSTSLTGSLGNAIKYQCFGIAGAHPTAVESTQPNPGQAFIEDVRSLLTSEDPNDTYCFISCLQSLDPALWAGTRADIPAVLEGWEVERIMNLLHSSDSMIRRKTLQVLLRVDRNVVETYYSQLMGSESTSSPPKTHPDGIEKVLEVIELLYTDDGEAYVQNILQLLRALDAQSANEKKHVSDIIVQSVLTRIRSASSEFRSNCLGILFVFLTEQTTHIDATLATILAALVCEFLENSPVPPTHLLTGLASLLNFQGAGVQDICLLAMTRVVGQCEEVPENVIAIVRKHQEAAGRHIRQRCDQFITLSESKETLKEVLAEMRTSSLPDLVIALQHWETQRRVNMGRANARISGATSPNRPSSRASQGTSSKLRYAAYEPPKPTARLRRTSSASSRSTSYSDAGRENEDLAKTFTPGELALVGGRRDLEKLAKVGSRNTLVYEMVCYEVLLCDPVVSNAYIQARRVDLINLDSPFVSEPATSISSLNEPDFEQLWNSLASGNARGWCEASIDSVVRKLQGLQRPLKVTPADQGPFVGDLKIILAHSNYAEEQQGIAVLRLREGDEDSCLWHLRCTDETLREAIKSLLKDTDA